MADKSGKQAIEYGIVPIDVMASMSGLDFVRAIFARRLPEPPIMQTVEPFDCAVEPGVVVIHSVPGLRHYNPIGGSGNRLAKIARTKSSPDIDAITPTATTPYSIVCLPDLSSMISRLVMPGTNPIREPSFFRKMHCRVKPAMTDATTPPSALVSLANFGDHSV